MVTIKRIAVHKRRIDRGRNYWAYIQILVTSAILVKVFDINSWWVYALGAVFVFGACYIFGYIDEKKNVLSNEQESYNDQNPLLKKINKDLEIIKEKLNGLDG